MRLENEQLNQLLYELSVNFFAKLIQMFADLSQIFHAICG